MVNKRKIAGALLAATVLLAGVGCAAMNKQAREMQERPGYRTTRVTDGLLPNRDHRNARRPGNFVTNDRSNLARGVRVADDAAREVADMREVDSAYVIVMGRTAYVAAVMPQKMGGKMVNRVKERVADRVKAVDPSIRNVYVSTNPDFVKQWRNFANDIRNGRPVSAFIDNLADLIRRTFPEAK
jgi:spore cortex protein